jgi:lysophospholipase L1-like esterase
MNASHPPRPGLLKFVLAIALGLAGAIGIAELLARLAWQEPPRRAPWRSGATPTGFRGGEYAQEPAPGVFRVVVGGDSVTFGVFVDPEQAYPHLLEETLNGAPGDGRFEVLNLGAPGINIRQLVARIATVGLRFNPDLIIYGWTPNDIISPAYRYSFAPSSWADRSPFYLARVLWPRWQAVAEMLFQPHDSYAYEVLDNYFDNPAAWEHFTAELDRLAKLGRARNVPVVVFLHSVLGYLNDRHPFRRVYDKVAAAAAERGLHPVRSFEIFLGRDPGAVVFPIDGHPNALGHRFLARALHDGLRDLDLVPRREQPTATAP